MLPWTRKRKVPDVCMLHYGRLHNELFPSCCLWDGQQSYPSFIMNIIHYFITNIIEIRDPTL